VPESRPGKKKKNSQLSSGQAGQIWAQNLMFRTSD
jgi:hypothetical protein